MSWNSPRFSHLRWTRGNSSIFISHFGYPLTSRQFFRIFFIHFVHKFFIIGSKKIRPWNLASEFLCIVIEKLRCSHAESIQKTSRTSNIQNRYKEETHKSFDAEVPNLFPRFFLKAHTICRKLRVFTVCLMKCPYRISKILSLFSNLL